MIIQEESVGSSQSKRIISRESIKINTTFKKTRYWEADIVKLQTLKPSKSTKSV